jgi:hypothetical protein
MTPTLRFGDLNTVGKTIIVAVGLLTLAVAAVAFMTSYGALYAWVRDSGLYSERLTRIYPLLLDAGFIIAQLTAILFGILHGNKVWPYLTMGVCGGLTVWFNLQHAGSDPGVRLTAAIPPILMILAFETDVAIVKAVMRALGKPLETTEAAETLLGPGMQNPSLARFQVSQLGHGRGSGGEVPATVGAGELETDAGVTKRTAVERYLARLGDNLTLLTNREIADDLAQDGVEVTAQYVGTVRSRFMSPAGQNGRRKDRS